MAWRPATVGTTAAELVSYNPRRRSLAIFNNGAAAIYISPDASITTTTGFLIPAGVALTLTERDGDEPSQPFYAVSGSAGQDVRIAEGFGGAEAP